MVDSGETRENPLLKSEVTKSNSERDLNSSIEEFLKYARTLTERDSHDFREYVSCMKEH